MADVCLEAKNLIIEGIEGGALPYRFGLSPREKTAIGRARREAITWAPLGFLILHLSSLKETSRA